MLLPDIADLCAAKPPCCVGHASAGALPSVSSHNKQHAGDVSARGAQIRVGLTEGAWYGHGEHLVPHV